MTVTDKLREILRVTGWKQKDLAGKFEVSPKTISFWMNGKMRPSNEKEKMIMELYDEVTDNTNVSDVERVIQDYQAKEGFDEFDKTFNPNQKNYYDAKCFVLAKEKDNNSHIFLYPSSYNKDDGWYKVGGRSLLFYKNLLASRLGREAKIRDDDDKAHRFRSGIASVRWGDKLMEEAKTFGYTAEKLQYGVIVIGLDKEFTDAEIHSMNEAVKAEKRRVQKMVKPKNNYPELMVAMNKLIQVLPSKVKKLDASYREVWGQELLQPMIEMTKIYFRFANGRMTKRDTKLEMLERVDDLMAMIYMMDECSMLNITVRTRLGENTVEIRKQIEENLN